MKLKISTIAILLTILTISPAWAHSGHIHAPVIKPDTHPHLQAAIMPYLLIQQSLAGRTLDDKVKQAAHDLAKHARAGALAEGSSTSGRTMLMEMFAGAQTIAAANNLESAQQGFGQINKAMLPFFKTWNGHLKEHGLTLFYCADEKARKSEDLIDFSKGWIQKEKSAQSPYNNICPHLQIQQGKK